MHIQPPSDWEISPQATVIQLNSQPPPLLIDCREEDEYSFCRITGAILVPLSRFAELVKAVDIPPEGAIIYCHHGIRSLSATKHLRDLDHENIFSMSGGIHQWSAEIDQSIPTY